MIQTNHLQAINAALEEARKLFAKKLKLEAVIRLEDTLHHLPSNIDIDSRIHLINELAYYLAHAGRRNDSFYYYRISLDLDPGHSETVTRYAKALARTGDIEGAQIILTAGHAKNPDDLSIRTEQGWLAAKKGHYNQAEQILSSVLILKENHSRALYKLGKTYAMQQGKLQLAQKHLQEAYKYATEKATRILNALAIVLVMQQDFLTAETKLLESIRLKKDDVLPHELLAFLFLKQNRLQSFYKHVIYAPKPDGIYDSLRILKAKALAAFLEGNVKEARSRSRLVISDELRFAGNRLDPAIASIFLASNPDPHDSIYKTIQQKMAAQFSGFEAESRTLSGNPQIIIRIHPGLFSILSFARRPKSPTAPAHRAQIQHARLALT